MGDFANGAIRCPGGPQFFMRMGPFRGRKAQESRQNNQADEASE